MADVNNINKVGEWSPTYILGMIKGFIYVKDYESALELAERSLKEAKEKGDSQWINEFEEQYSEINQMIPNETDEEDLTQISGVGRVLEGKLKLTGFKSIAQLANANPQKLSEAEGLGLKGANKIILSAKELLRIKDNDKNDKGKNTLHVKETIPKQKKLSNGWLSPNKIEVNDDDDEEENEIIESEYDNNENIGNKYDGGRMFEKKFKIDRRSKSLPPIKSSIEIPELPEENAKLESMLDIKPLEKEDVEMAPEYESYAVEPFMEEEKQKEKEIENYSKSLDTNEEDDNNSFDSDDYGEKFDNGYEVDQYEMRPDLELRIKKLVKHFTDDTTEDTEEEKPKKTRNFKKQVEQDFNDSFPEERFKPKYEKPKQAERFVIDNDYSLEDELLNEKEVKKLGSEVINVFKSRDYSILSKKIKNIDFLALNLIKVEDNLRVINILPVKISNLKGSIIVSEDECGYNPFSEDLETDKMQLYELLDNIEKVMKRSQKHAFVNFTLGNSLFLYVKKGFDHKLKIERTKSKKNILIRAGPIRYKLIIDPLYICQKEVQFEEKLIPFAYQRKSNIHFINLKALNNLLEFLEKKYHLIEKRSGDKDSVKKYFEMKDKLIIDAGKYSIPFIVVPSLLLLLMVFVPSISGICFNLSIAFIVIYGITLGYLYLGFFKKKGDLIKLFNTPYYQRPIGVDETDIEIISGMLSFKLLDQFIYECFGKKAEFDILANMEEEKSAIRFDRPEIKDKKDLKKDKDTIVSNYSQLLEDLD